MANYAKYLKVHLDVFPELVSSEGRATPLICKIVSLAMSLYSQVVLEFSKIKHFQPKYFIQ